MNSKHGKGYFRAERKPLFLKEYPNEWRIDCYVFGHGFRLFNRIKRLYKPTQAKKVLATYNNRLANLLVNLKVPRGTKDDRFIKYMRSGSKVMLKGLLKDYPIRVGLKMSDEWCNETTIILRKYIKKDLRKMGSSAAWRIAKGSVENPYPVARNVVFQIMDSNKSRATIDQIYLLLKYFVNKFGKDKTIKINVTRKVKRLPKKA